MNGLVSVILVINNEKIEDLLEKIKHILSQTYENIEIVIVDNCGNDEVYEGLVSSPYESDSRLVYIKNDNITVLADAYNVGINESSGEWITFATFDSEWENSRIEKLFSAYEVGSGFVYSAIECNEEIIPSSKYSYDELQGNIFYQELIFDICDYRTIFVNRSVLENIDSVYEKYKNSCLREFIIRLSRKYKASFSSESLVHTSVCSINNGDCDILYDYRDLVKDYKEIALNNLLNKAKQYGKINIIYETAQNLVKDDVFENLLIEHYKTNLPLNAYRRIAIYFNDENIEFGSCYYPELGNPGIGGSEYELLMLVKYLASVNPNALITVYHLNKNNRMPFGVRDVNCNDEYDMLEKYLQDYQDILIRIFIGNFDVGLQTMGENNICFIGWLTLRQFDDITLKENVLSHKIPQKLVCVSKSAYEEYDGDKIQDRMTYINNACPANSAVGRSFDKSNHTVTYIGALINTKGFHLLAEAWPKVLQKVPDAKLNVIGGGNLYSKNRILGKYGIAEEKYEQEFIKYLVDDCGKIIDSVIFHGVMGIEKSAIIAQTSVGVVNPSGLTETFCISAVDFEQAGVPVVTKKCKGLETTVIDGVTGIMIDGVDELANAIIKLLLDTDLNMKLSKNAIEYVQDKFEINKIALEWNTLIENTIQEQDNKVKIVVWDLIGNYRSVISNKLDSRQIIINNVISSVSGEMLNDILSKTHWNVLVINENGLKNEIQEILDALKVPKERVLFINDPKYVITNNFNDVLLMYKKTSPEYKYVNNEIMSPEKGHTVVDVEGLSFVGNSSDKCIIPTMILMNEVWAKEEMMLFDKLVDKYYKVDKTGYFLDIGANIGTTGIYFKKRIQKEIKLIAFEPEENNYRLLRTNAMMNGVYDGSKFVNIGLDEITTKRKMSIVDSNPGQNSMVGMYSDCSFTTVNTMTLEEYCSNEGISGDEISYMWVDTEGFEPSVLSGAKKLIRDFKIPLFMEFTPTIYDTAGTFDKLIEILSSAYSKYIIVQDYLDGNDDEYAIEELIKFKGKEEFTQFDIFLIK